jgi:DNA processing protein
MESILCLHRATLGRPGLAQKLEHHYGDAETVFLEFDARETPLPAVICANISASETLRREAAADLQWLLGDSCHLLDQSHPLYPEQLKVFPDAPYLLFLWGDLHHLAKEQLSIVGSRRPTHHGVSTAVEMATQLVSAGLTITSGLAIGVDAAAHRGAIEAGGATIAVQGCGIDKVYPRSHEGLARRILNSGCLVSEYPTGVAAHARHFPQRNRIVTGLSRGTLVIEAAIKSGSLISARLAMDQGKEVFAVPGSIYAAQSEGCHQLIRQGAVLVTSVLDILEELPDFVINRNRIPARLSKREQLVIDVITRGPCHADRIHEETKLSLDLLLALLIDLEIRGVVGSGPDGYRVLGP